MAQGDFTKQEARATHDAFEEIFNALSDAKKQTFLGQANDIYLFLDAAEKAAPENLTVDGDPQ